MPSRALDLVILENHEYIEPVIDIYMSRQRRRAANRFLIGNNIYHYTDIFRQHADIFCMKYASYITLNKRFKGLFSFYYLVHANVSSQYVGVTVFSTNFLDSGFRRNDEKTQPAVIPAKAGIQTGYPSLLRCYMQTLFALYRLDTFSSAFKTYS